MSDRLIRWLLYLQNFDYEIVHVKGSNNKIADILSRKPHDREAVLDSKIKEFLMATLPIDRKEGIENKLLKIKELQQADEKIVRNLRTPDKGFVMDKGIVYVEKRTGQRVIYLPSVLIQDVTGYLHQELGHAGTGKTYAVLTQYFYFKNMYKFVRKIVSSCDICQKAKCTNQNFEGPLYPIIPESIGSLVSVDFYGPLPKSTYGATYIFVVLDVFSKFVKLYPLRRATANAAIAKIQDFIKTIPIKAILADHGSQFKARRWQRFCKDKGIKPGFTSINHPASNPVERVMREIGRMLRTYCHAHNQGWVKVLHEIEECMNSIPHDSTGVSAIKIISGEEPKRNFDRVLSILWPNVRSEEDLLDKVRERLRSRADRRKIVFDRCVRKIQFKVDNLVLLKRINLSKKEQKISAKLQLLYEGPYKIVSLPFRNVAQLVHPVSGKIRGNYNFALLKPFKEYVSTISGE